MIHGSVEFIQNWQSFIHNKIGSKDNGSASESIDDLFS